MAEFTVRLWVDVQVDAIDEKMAKFIADGIPVEVGDYEIYQIQTEKVWRKDGEIINA